MNGAPAPTRLRAYGDDVARFLAFQRGHLGGAVSEKALATLKPADIRAFITARRAEGLGAGGVQRALAAVRSFYRFLARENILENAAPARRPHAAPEAPPAAALERDRCGAGDRGSGRA